VVNADRTPKVGRTKLLDLQINAIERREGKRASVITYSALVEALSDEGRRDTMYFYNQRGSNDLEDCEVLVVVGAPCPPMDAIVKEASMILSRDMRAFDDRWITNPRPFLYEAPDGKARIGEASEFADPRLNAFLRERRDNELIQAVHRARIVSRDANVYLLTSLPVQGLVVDELITVAELVGMPAEKDRYSISDTVRMEGREIADRIVDEQGYVDTESLVEAGLSSDKAERLMRDLAKDPAWESFKVRARNGWKTAYRRVEKGE
jgi:hypothetical protein